MLQKIKSDIPLKCNGYYSVLIELINISNARTINVIKALTYSFHIVFVLKKL